jgi:hypothetical protein
MPKQLTKGKAQVATQITEDVLTAFKDYAEGRGETLSAALERAMRREMAYPPPPVEDPPLGDSPAARPAPAKKARRGSSR